MVVLISSQSTYFRLMFIIVMVISSNWEMVKPNPLCPPETPEHGIAVAEEDIDPMQFAENLEHLEADYFMWGAFGYGLDEVAPELVMGGPPPIGAPKADLDELLRTPIMQEFALQEVGHLSALKSTVGGFPRPLMDLSSKNFAKLFVEAFGRPLVPPFNPYRDSFHTSD